MNSDFESQLQRQPMRELPREWRAEILAGAAERGRAHLDTTRVRPNEPLSLTLSPRGGAREPANRVGAGSRCAHRGRSPLAAQLSVWLSPYPRGWAALGAAWVVILLLHVTAPEEPRLAHNSYAPASESIAIMRQQSLIMAQLLGSMENGPASPALPSAPKPRSERALEQLVG